MAFSAHASPVPVTTVLALAVAVADPGAGRAVEAWQALAAARTAGARVFARRAHAGAVVVRAPGAAVSSGPAPGCAHVAARAVPAVQAPAATQACAATEATFHVQSCNALELCTTLGTRFHPH